MTAIAYGAEYTYTVAPHNKYWQVISSGNVVATRYGRRGSLGSVTVHHMIGPSHAGAKRDALIAEKIRKGYRSTPNSQLTFSLPSPILTVAASVTGHTGRGGVNPHAGYALIAYYAEAARASRVTLKSEDVLVQEIVNGHTQPRRVALAALAGYRITDKALTELDDESLEVMAGLLSLGNSYDISTV